MGVQFYVPIDTQILAVTGASTLASTSVTSLNASGASTLANTSVTSLNSSGASTLANTSVTSLSASNLITASNGINVTGSTVVQALQVSGSTIVQALNVEGQVNLDHNINVGENINVIGNVNVGGDIHVNTLHVTGMTTAPTALNGTTTTQIATTEFVHNSINIFTTVSSNTLTILDTLSSALAADTGPNGVQNGIIKVVTDEKSRAEGIEGVLRTDLDAVVTRVLAAENLLDNQKILFPSPSIYADGAAMALPPIDMVRRGVNGWYFKNDSANKKINWYMPNVPMKVSDIKGLYLDMFNGNNTNTFNMPFITVYTAKDAGPNASSWYKSKKGYTVLLPTSTISSNTHYTPFMNVSGSCAQPVLKTGSSIATMIKNEDPSVSKGTFGPDEDVFLISIGSASTATLNNVEFCISKFGITIGDKTQELIFSDAMKGSLFTDSVTLSTGDMNVSTGNIVLNSKVAGKGLIQFAARDTPETVPYKMGVSIDGTSDKLVIMKGGDVLMSISNNGYSAASAVDTVTFSAPVVMTDILDLTSAGCKIKLSSTQYITGADFLSFLSNSSITKHTF